MKNYFERYGYIAVTVLSSVVTFIKSYLFMDILTKEDLGYMALFQSMILIVNFFQMGVIYGGYRVISFSISRQRKVNDAVVTYLFLLLSVFTFLFFILNFFISISWFWTIGMIVGLLSLWANWISNMFIALGKTNKLSLVTLISIGLSFIALPLLYSYSVYGAITLIALQPIFFILFSYLFNQDFRFKINFKSVVYLRLIIKLGFIPFVTGVLHYINLQVERWVIGIDLGVKALGDYYLVFVYVGLFAVIPSALGTLNFPKFMKMLSREKNDFQNLAKIFKLYYIEIVSYLLFIGLSTFYIMPWIIKMILPAHETGVYYVQIVFVGLVVFTLIDPISFIINAKLHYRELLYIYIGALSISSLCYCFLYFNKLGSLINYSYVNVIFYISVSVGYIIYFSSKGLKKNRKKGLICN
jgi:O-antigen/teichoic acid export membrane protein